MPQTDAWGQLDQDVIAKEGVLTVPMKRLRDAVGVSRLGPHVASQISKKLHSVGLGHHPPDLPQYQEDYVLIYKLGSPLAELIGALNNPSPENDVRLRRVSGGNPQLVIEQIRALVCD